MARGKGLPRRTASPPSKGTTSRLPFPRPVTGYLLRRQLEGINLLLQPREGSL